MYDISVNNIMQIIGEIAKHSEVVAGGPRERQQVELIRTYLENYVDEVFLEPVEVTFWDEHFCLIYIDEKPRICSIHPPYRGYVDIDIDKNRIIYIEKFNDVYKLADDLSKKIVLVNNIKDPNYITIYFHTIKQFDPLAIVFIDQLNTLRRIVVMDDLISRYNHIPPPNIPPIHVDNETGIKLRNANKIQIVAKSELKPSYGYNIISRINGPEDNTFYLTSHHDHWFNGVIDDVTGVALILNLAQSQILRNIVKSNIILAFFTAEEGFTNPLSTFYWLVGSRKHVATNAHKILDDPPLVINIDVVYKNKIKFATSNLLARGFLMKLGMDTDNIEHDSMLYDSFSFTSLGIPSITIHSYEAVLNAGLYHSTLDSIEAVDPNTITNILNTVITLIKGIESYRKTTYSQLLQLGMKTLINEIVSKPIPLEIVLGLHKVLKRILSCNTQKLHNYSPTFHRTITSTYIPIGIYKGLEIYERTSYATCKNDVVYLPTAPDLGNDCYRNLLYNLESLTYILCY